MKKIITGVVAVALVLTLNTAFANNNENGKPFKILWQAINSIQEQIDNIQLIPGDQGEIGPIGPQGEKGDKGDPGEPSWDEERMIELEERVSELEKSLSEPRVGARLEDYIKPTEQDCDINVPVQYSTIGAAIDAASNGDTICVGPGIYNENQIKISKAIRLAGNGFVNDSIINSSNPYSTIQILSGNVTIEGFVINGVGLGKYNSAILILADAGPNITIQNNRIVSADGSIALRSDSRLENYVVRNNIMTGNNSFSIMYIDSHSPTFTIWNNTFTGTVNDASYGSVLQTAANSSIQRNIFDATGTMRWLLLYGCVPGTIDVNYNNFNSDDARTKVEACQGSINAEDNWWGVSDPSDNPNSIYFTGDVNYTPFTTKPFKQN